MFVAFGQILPAHAAPKVVATVLPVHSLAAMVMDGVSTPDLLIPPGASPHNFALKPSDSRRLNAADLVIWVGPALEPGLRKSISGLSGRNRVLSLLDLPEITRLDARPASLGPDPHIWLDPDNARVILKAIAMRLGERDPANKRRYLTNAQKAVARISARDAEWAATLRPLARAPFVTFHDAYQYLELHFGLQNIGFVVNDPSHPVAGARHIRDLRRAIVDSGARCIFTEPEYAPNLIYPVTENLGMKTAVLDHMGSKVAMGRDAYLDLMDRMVANFAACLAS